MPPPIRPRNYPTNRDRASWARDGLMQFAATTGLDRDDLVTQTGDFLADLMHLLNLEGYDFEELLARGREHFEAELEEEAELPPGRKEWDPRG